MKINVPFKNVREGIVIYRFSSALFNIVLFECVLFLNLICDLMKELLL